jgi:uncharacterized RDD family membrane protein YckC
VSVGHDAHLDAGQAADSVVSILGSSTADGDVADAVVSIVGNTRVTGFVGDAAVSVFGSTYVNGKVRGDVVAVLGNVELGAQAEVDGQVVAVGGTTARDPQAVVHGGVENVGPGVAFTQFTGLHAWFEKALMYGRPLALDDRLIWAWIIAFSLLASYVLVALLFRNGVERCARTLAEHPGQAVLTAIVAALLSPVVIVLLCITVIGIPVVPFLIVALFGAALFGKTAVLAWIGQRILPSRSAHPVHPALGVLVGGIVMLVLYSIPVLGFIAFNVLGVLGFGAAMYTAILSLRSGKASSSPAESAGAAPETVATTAEPVMNTASNAETTAQAQPQANASPSNISATLPRAGFWLRMGALVIDLIITGIVMSILHHSGNFHLIVLAAYGAIMWKLKRTTIGGIVCGIAVVRVDEREIDWGTAIVRALACFLSLVVAGLGFLWIAFDENKQAWHDKIAGTVVVRVPKGISLL